MRAILKGNIVSTSRNDDGFVHIQVTLKGKVTAGAKYGEAKETKMSGELLLKPVVADDIKIGSVITVEVNDEEPDNRIE